MMLMQLMIVEYLIVPSIQPNAAGESASSDLVGGLAMGNEGVGGSSRAAAGVTCEPVIPRISRIAAMRVIQAREMWFLLIFILLSKP